MQNKSSLSLIGSIVLGSLVRNLKIKGSSSTVNPKDLSSGIDIVFTISFPWTDFVSIENFEDFIDHIRHISNIFRLGLNVSDEDYAVFLDCIVDGQENFNHEFHWELCEKLTKIVLGYPANLNELRKSVDKSKKLFHYTKDLHVKHIWPSVEEVRSGEEDEITLDVYMTVNFCDYDTITEISESISELIGDFFGASPISITPIRVDPSGKLSEKAKHLIYGTKSKSELRKF